MTRIGSTELKPQDFQLKTWKLTRKLKICLSGLFSMSLISILLLKLIIDLLIIFIAKLTEYYSVKTRYYFFNFDIPVSRRRHLKVYVYKFFSYLWMWMIFLQFVTPIPLTKTYETNKFGDTKLFEKKTNNQTKNNT